MPADIHATTIVVRRSFATALRCAGQGFAGTESEAASTAIERFAAQPDAARKPYMDEAAGGEALRAGHVGTRMALDLTEAAQDALRTSFGDTPADQAIVASLMWSAEHHPRQYGILTRTSWKAFDS